MKTKKVYLGKSKDGKYKRYRYLVPNAVRSKKITKMLEASSRQSKPSTKS